MDYEPLYYARAWRRGKPEVFLYIVTFCLFLQSKIGTVYVPFCQFLQNKVGTICLDLSSFILGVLTKQLFHSRLWDMRW